MSSGYKLGGFILRVSFCTECLLAAGTFGIAKGKSQSVHRPPPRKRKSFSCSLLRTPSSNSQGATYGIRLRENCRPSKPTDCKDVRYLQCSLRLRREAL